MLTHDVDFLLSNIKPYELGNSMHPSSLRMDVIVGDLKRLSKLPEPEISYWNIVGLGQKFGPCNSLKTDSFFIKARTISI